jgi:hypothetical protein
VSLKDKIEHRLNIYFGAFKTPPENIDDWRLSVRFGFGDRRQYPNFEASFFGWAVYFGRIDWGQVETKREADPVVRPIRGNTVKEIFERWPR